MNISQYFYNQPFMYCCAVLAITVFFSGLFFVLYRYYYPKFCQSPRVWDDTLLKALYLPLQVALWLYSLTYAAEALRLHHDFYAFHTIGIHVRDFISILCLLWFMWKYIAFFEQRVTDNHYKSLALYNKAKLLSLCRFMRVLIIFIGIVVFLQANGIPVSGLLAFGGMGALVLGLAAKDLLANFFGGLLIYADRPFTVGDWINSPDKDIEGNVERIGWRLTTVRRFDKRLLYIPNSIFSTITLENGSAMTHRRLLLTIGLRYADLPVVNPLCDAITQILATHPQLDKKAAYFAKLDSFSASSIDIKIQAFTKHIDNTVFIGLQHQLLLEIAAAVAQAGADFAFPTRTVEIAKSGPVIQASDAH